MSSLSTSIAEPWVISLVFVLPVLAVVRYWAARRSKTALLKIGQPTAMYGLLTCNRRLHWVKGILLSAAMSMLVFAAAGPQWGHSSKSEVLGGRDLIVLLDMSNSMRATDAPPNRFARAVEGLQELTRYLRTRGGHRIGLVVFAGDAQIVCPLTHDYGHFAAKLTELDLDYPPPALRSRPGMRSGTRIGAGIQLGVSAHDPRLKGYQDVILMSDGHDPAGNEEWESGLTSVLSSGVPVSAIGIGNPDTTGVAINVPGRDEAVPTRLHEYPLQEIARQTRGWYQCFGTEPIRLAEFFRHRIEPKGSMSPTDDLPDLPRPQHVWFYFAALILLTAMVLVSLRRSDVYWVRGRMRMNQGHSTPSRIEASRLWWSVTLAIVAFVLLASSPRPEVVERQGQAAFDAGRYDEAASFFQMAGERSGEPGRIAFNHGVVLFHMGRYRESEQEFRAALESGDRNGQALYNLGTCLLHASTGGDRDRIGEAILLLTRCLEHAEGDSQLYRSAAHNLELAKRFWRQGNDRALPPEPESNARDQDLVRDSHSETSSEVESSDQLNRQKGSGTTRPVPTGSNANSNVSNENPRPGRGTLSPITTEEQSGPLPPWEARELLRQAGERIARERRVLTRSVSPTRDYPDW